LPVVGEAKQAMQDNYRVSLAKFTGKKFHIAKRAKERSHIPQGTRERSLAG
jgi:predicted RNA-binding protein associated with RNAse of E/G family